MDELANQIGEMLNTCLEQGMVLPFIVVSVSTNGSVLVLRYEQGDERLDAVSLAEHVVQPGFILPINCMLVDQAGDAARIVIAQDGITYH